MNLTRIFTKKSKYRASEETSFLAEVVKNKSITIKNESRLEISPITFKMGDVCEYDSWNLSYMGTIEKITDKTITIDTNGTYDKITKKSLVRLDLSRFAMRNYDFNLERLSAENLDTMMYI